MDAQERLTFRVQTFVRDQIRSYRPTAADLRCLVASAATGPGAAPERLWYVTVDRALSCLAQLYRCVPRGVFEGLAEDILTECAASVRRAAEALRQQRASRGTVEAADLEATLFTIAQLLTLREQIAPFETDFAITQKALDFTQTREAMRSLMERRGRLGGLGGALELLQSGAPSIIQSHRDAKVALDAELRECCERYIRHNTDAATRALTSLIVNQASAAGSDADALLDPIQVAAALDAAEGGVQGEVTRCRRLMAEYLPEPATQQILFGPIRSQILDTLGQVETLVNATDLPLPKAKTMPRTSSTAAAEDGAGAQLPWSERLARIAELVNALARAESVPA